MYLLDLRRVDGFSNFHPWEVEIITPTLVAQTEGIMESGKTLHHLENIQLDQPFPSGSPVERLGGLPKGLWTRLQVLSWLLLVSVPGTEVIGQAAAE